MAPPRHVAAGTGVKILVFFCCCMTFTLQKNLWQGLLDHRHQKRGRGLLCLTQIQLLFLLLFPAFVSEVSILVTIITLELGLIPGLLPVFWFLAVSLRMLTLASTSAATSASTYAAIRRLLVLVDAFVSNAFSSLLRRRSWSFSS